VNNLEGYLKEVRNRCDAATKGQWKIVKFEEDEKLFIKTKDGTIFPNYSDMSSVSCAVNVNFISHARKDIEMLLKIVDGLLMNQNKLISGKGNGQNR